MTKNNEAPTKEGAGKFLLFGIIAILISTIISLINDVIMENKIYVMPYILTIIGMFLGYLLLFYIVKSLLKRIYKNKKYYSSATFSEKFTHAFATLIILFGIYPIMEMIITKDFQNWISSIANSLTIMGLGITVTSLMDNQVKERVEKQLHDTKKEEEYATLLKEIDKKHEELNKVFHYEYSTILKVIEEQQKVVNHYEEDNKRLLEEKEEYLKENKKILSLLEEIKEKTEREHRIKDRKKTARRKI